MVTVQLVEKRVKSSVGIVIVVKRTAQYRIAETTCKTAMISQARKPSQLEEPWVATTPWARSSAEGRGAEAFTTVDRFCETVVATALGMSPAMFSDKRGIKAMPA